MRKYAVVQCVASYGEGVFMADMEPIPNLLLVHHHQEENYLYVVDKEKPLVDSLEEAKGLINTKYSSSFIKRTQEQDLAIVEVSGEEDEITEFCNLYTMKKGGWEKYPIQKGHLTGDALELINEMYQQPTECRIVF